MYLFVDPVFTFVKDFTLCEMRCFQGLTFYCLKWRQNKSHTAVGLRNVCGPMKCSCSRLDWLHPVPSLTQSMHVLWTMCSFYSCTKDLKAVVFFCFLKTFSLSVCFCLLIHYGTFLLIGQALLSCLYSLLKAVVLSRYHGSRLLVDSVSFISLEVVKGGVLFTYDQQSQSF